ncbi:AraC family transcriptional regulator [Sphingobacteriaceae bacterium]|nr:AraC family transcriptional regulator [Sphingobacteriaceae bacterium]
MQSSSLLEFYEKLAAVTEGGMDYLLPNGLDSEHGHVNIVDVKDLALRYTGGDNAMPYNRKTYYKISLVCAKSICEYADRVIQIERYALVYGTPKIPYNWIPQEEVTDGFFCIFTADFLISGNAGFVLDELPIFQAGGFPVFEISSEDIENVKNIFKKIQTELKSDYAYKYDLIRNYVLELIHFGQKLQPLTSELVTHNASARVSSLFMDLLERQFPIATPGQKVNLRSAKDYAHQLSVHINHLNKVLKESTGKTTTEHINGRLVQEAKILLRHSDWNISEIAYSLGFEQLSHFSTFFKKQTSVSPNTIRNQAT